MYIKSHLISHLIFNRLSGVGSRGEQLKQYIKVYNNNNNNNLYLCSPFLNRATKCFTDKKKESKTNKQK